MLVCTKFYNDIYFSNSDIATISGIALEELNHIERYYLETIDYSLFVSPDEYCHYEQGLRSHIETSESNYQH